jgi:glycyl-tRNA synthetase beta subunit
MEKYQRYFPVSGSNRFVVVADGVAPGSGRVKKIRNIRAGNEKVLAARLGDARFFY